MIYTQEQINEIRRRLSAMGVRDSNIKELDLTKVALTGNETVVIVKNSENVRVPISSLVPVSMLEDVQLVTQDDEPYLCFIFKTTEGDKVITVPLSSLLSGLGDKIQNLEDRLLTLEVNEAEDIANIQNEINNHKIQINTINGLITSLNLKVPNLESKISTLERKVQSLERAINDDDSDDSSGVKLYYNVTYDELVNLRNNSALIPGTKYRITDYDVYDGSEVEFAECSGIADLPEFKSAHHHFDILVTAIDNSHLDCNAKALHSARDTENYFTNVDLSKWELKYDLDNDKSKYSWALNTNYRKQAEYKSYSFSQGEIPADADVLYKFNLGGALVDIEHIAKEATGTVINIDTSGFTGTGLPLGFDLISVGSEAVVTLRKEGTNLIAIVTSGANQIFNMTIASNKKLDIYYRNAYQHLEGKGIIYYMKDDENNECPYDFKNIMFKCGDEHVYTFDANEDVTIVPEYTEEYINIQKNSYSTVTAPETQEVNDPTVPYKYVTTITSVLSASIGYMIIRINTELPNVTFIVQNTNDTEVYYRDVNGNLITTNIEGSNDIGQIKGGGTRSVVTNSFVVKTEDGVAWIRCKNTSEDSINYVTVGIPGYTKHYEADNARNNIIMPYINNRGQHLNNNVFLVKKNNNYTLKENYIGYNSHDITVNGSAVNNKFGNYNYNNSYQGLIGCKTGDDCINITINCGANTCIIGKDCHNISVSASHMDDCIIEDYVNNKEVTGETLQYYKVVNGITYTEVS